MADNVNKNNIDDIVSGVRKALEMGELSDSGISFEFVDESEEQAPAVTFEDAEPIADAQPAAPEPIAPSEPEPENKPEESISAKKPVEDPTPKKEDSESVVGGIWTTYVPRFTEVSDTYRMRRNDYVEQKETPAPPKKERELPITVSEDAPDLIVDPTAEPECESAILDATLISSGTNAATAENDEIATFFKFDNAQPQAAESIPEPAAIDVQEEPEVQQEPAPDESPLDLEADEISEPVSEDSLSDSEESDPEDLTDPEPAAIERDPDKPYVMPDPDVAVPIVNLPAERQTMALEVVDEEVGRRKRSEYTSFSDKDGFYDSFIDSIMSVRVRVVSVIFISLMLLLFENLSFLGIDIVRLMRFEGVGGGMAIITLPFIAGIFLLALPEVTYSFLSLSK